MKPPSHRLLIVLLLALAIAAPVLLHGQGVSAEPAVPAPVAQPPGPPALFTAVDGVGGADLPANPTVLRSRLVQARLDVLPAADAVGPATPVVALDLFPDAQYQAVLERLETSAVGGYTWVGHLQDVVESEVYLAVADGVLAGKVTTPDATYKVAYAGGNYMVQEINRLAFPPELVRIPAEVGPAAPAPEGDALAPAADACNSIDLMVLYTPEVAAEAGGVSALTSALNTVVSEGNTGYNNSGITQRVRLVHTAQVNYSEASFDWNLALDRLTGTSDTYIDNIHTLRNTYKADVVTLLVSLPNELNYCGLGWLMTSPSAGFATNAFSIVKYDCAGGNLSMFHEMGHNMGSHHDRANSINPDTGQVEPGSYVYSHGYQAPDKSFRTVMAYNCTSPGCPRVNRWSNPERTYNSLATGVDYLSPQSADNRRSLNGTACFVANWRLGTTVTLPKRAFLPFVVRGLAPPAGIGGRVTYMGNPVAGINLELRFYNGAGWSSAGLSTTGSDGRYRFNPVTPLSAGQIYYLLYRNNFNGNARNVNYLWIWYGRNLTGVAANASVAGGDFDLVDVVMNNPGASVPIPANFSWNRRGSTPSDSYVVELFALSAASPYFATSPLGYVANYTLGSMPAGFGPGTAYGWDMGVYDPQGGRGWSYYYWQFQFSGGMADPAIVGPAPRGDVDPFMVDRLEAARAGGAH